MELVSKKEAEMETINDVIEVMTEQLRGFQESRDHRVVFHRVYLLMTKEMQRRLSSGFFRDPAWLERVLVGFAEYYFHAIDAYENGQFCPPAWELAFRQASEKQAFVLQDALLGINAHINSDLPMVMHKILTEEKVWPDARKMLHRRQDHERINNVLAGIIDLVQDELSYYYARFIRVIDYVMGRKDESLSSLVLSHCRTTVWYNTELLLDASDEEQLNIQRHRIEKDALNIGQKVINLPAMKCIKYLAPLTRKNRWF
jgi:hypothetical protein